MDDKHINIRAPPDSGTIYFNYKNLFSIVLMAVADAKYHFLSVSVGNPGSNSGGGIFNLSSLSSAIEGKYAGLPDPDVLVGNDVLIPYHIIGDDAFAMKAWLMKPFSQRNLKKKCKFLITDSRVLVELSRTPLGFWELGSDVFWLH